VCVLFENVSHPNSTSHSILFCLQNHAFKQSFILTSSTHPFLHAVLRISNLLKLAFLSTAALSSFDLKSSTSKVPIKRHCVLIFLVLVSIILQKVEFFCHSSWKVGTPICSCSMKKIIWIILVQSFMSLVTFKPLKVSDGTTLLSMGVICMGCHFVTWLSWTYYHYCLS